MPTTYVLLLVCAAVPDPADHADPVSAEPVPLERAIAPDTILVPEAAVEPDPLAVPNGAVDTCDNALPFQPEAERVFAAELKRQGLTPERADVLHAAEKHRLLLHTYRVVVRVDNEIETLDGFYLTAAPCVGCGVVTENLCCSAPLMAAGAVALGFCYVPLAALCAVPLWPCLTAKIFVEQTPWRVASAYRQASNRDRCRSLQEEMAEAVDRAAAGEPSQTY